MAAFVSALLALVALLPATASAALDVRRVGDALTVTGSTSGDTQIEINADQSVFVAGSEVAVSTSTPATCANKGDYVDCGDATLTSLSLALTGNGDDSLQITDAPFMPTAALTVNTGAGNDDLIVSGEPRVIADLGPGNDQAATDEGADELHGGPGNDTLAGGPGNDRIWGDDGNDRFVSDPTVDGDDTFDGGADTQTATGPAALAGNGTGTGGTGSSTGSAGTGNSTAATAGDTVDYGARRTAVAVVLPPDSRTIPEGDNGAPAEHDRLAHVENATGAGLPRGNDASASTLTGNDRPNVLIGGIGPDELSGAGGADLLRGGLGNDRYDAGDGADLIDSRTGTGPPGSPTAAGDPDTQIDCGAGDDGLRRDPSDSEGSGCEHQAPLLLEAPQVTGNPRVGNLLSATRGATLGEIGTVSTSWYSCPPAAAPKAGQSLEDPALGCRVSGTSATYVPADRELGRVILAQVELPWAFGGDGASGTTAPFGPLGAALPTDPVLEQRPADEINPGGPAIRPGETFAEAARRQAIGRLGKGAVASNLTLGPGTAIYETPASLGGKFPVTASSTRTIAAVACERACTLSVRGTVRLTPANPKKRIRSVALREQRFAIAAGSVATVVFNATAAQRGAMAKAKKAKLTLTYELRPSAGATRRATKRYVVRTHAAGTA